MKPSPQTSHRIWNNTLWLTLDQMVNLAAGIIGSVLVARTLGPVKLGYYSYVFWIISVTLTVGHFGVPRATGKYVAEFIARNELALARRVFRMTLHFQVASALIITAAGLTVVAFAVPPEHQIYSAIAVLCIPIGMVMMVYSAGNAAVEDLKANVWPSLVATLVNIAGVLLTLARGWDLVGLASSLLVARLVDFIFRYYLFRRRIGRLWKGVNDRAVSTATLSDVRARVRAFCVQAALIQAVHMVVWDRSEIFFLKQFSPIEHIAFYSLTFNISQQLLIVPRSFASAVGVSMMVRADTDPAGTARMAITALRMMSILALPLTFTVAALSGPLIHLLYGARYEPAAPVLAVLALFCSAKVLVLPVQQALVAIDRQQTILRIMIICGILNLVLDVWLIRVAGALGAALANGVAQTAAAAVLWIAAKRILPLALSEARLTRIMLASMTAAVPGLLLAWNLPVGMALTFGSFTAIGLYFVMLRLLRVIPVDDRGRLLGLEQKLPKHFRRWYRTAMCAVAG